MVLIATTVATMHIFVSFPLPGMNVAPLLTASNDSNDKK